jgi:hypothetical protein
MNAPNKKIEAATMPASLLSAEGEAWLLRGKLLMDAFNNRDNGHYFRRAGEIEDAYRALSPDKFMEQFDGNLA